MKNTEFVNSEFKSLLNKFQSGNCDLEELRHLEEMFLDAGISGNIKSTMLNEISDFEKAGSGKDADYDRLFRSIQKVISEQQSNKRTINLRFNMVRIAALIVVAFVLGGTMSYFLFRNEIKSTASFCEVTAPLLSLIHI